MMRRPARMRFFSYNPRAEHSGPDQEGEITCWIAKDVPVRGLVFDVETGLLREPQRIPQQTAT
jgi:hypothetical protein